MRQYDVEVLDPRKVTRVCYEPAGARSGVQEQCTIVLADQDRRRLAATRGSPTSTPQDRDPHQSIVPRTPTLLFAPLLRPGKGGGAWPGKMRWATFGNVPAVLGGLRRIAGRPDGTLTPVQG